MRGKKLILRVLLTVAIVAAVLFVPQSVCAKEKKPPEKKAVEIKKEEVPLGLESEEQFHAYKRGVAVLVIICTSMVVITVVASVKENRDKVKYN